LRKKKNEPPRMKPEEVQYRCWGLQKLPGYDYENLPFIMARDNLGI
jgi:hypothetical protein